MNLRDYSKETLKEMGRDLMDEADYFVDQFGYGHAGSRHMQACILLQLIEMNEHLRALRGIEDTPMTKGAM